MKDRLLDRADVNVVIVDWGRGSGPPYNQAVANIRMVGYITASLLFHMKVGPPDLTTSYSEVMEWRMVSL